MSKRGKEGRVEKISTGTLVCSQDGPTSAFYGHLQEQKLSTERVSLCSNVRCRPGNISPGWGLCWWDTRPWSHRTALQRAGWAQRCHYSDQPGSGVQGVQTLWAESRNCLGAQAQQYSPSLAEWGLAPLCSKVSPVISWTKGSPGKTSGADHAVAALIFVFPSSYSAK